MHVAYHTVFFKCGCIIHKNLYVVKEGEYEIGKCSSREAHIDQDVTAIRGHQIPGTVMVNSSYQAGRRVMYILQNRVL